MICKLNYFKYEKKYVNLIQKKKFMNNKFYCNSKQRKFLIIFEFKFFIKSFIKKIIFFKKQSSYCKEEFKLRNRYSIRKVKSFLISEGISIFENKQVSWFYTALTKKKVDFLTRFALTYIEKRLSIEVHHPRTSYVLRKVNYSL